MKLGIMKGGDNRGYGKGGKDERKMEREVRMRERWKGR